MARRKKKNASPQTVLTPQEREVVKRGLVQAKELRHAGDEETALHIYDKILEVEPENSEANYFAGAASLMARDYADAVLHLEKAAEYGPDHAKLYNDLGLAYLCVERLDESQEALEAARKLNPNMGAVYDTLGKTLAAKGDADGAEEAFRQGLKKDPDFLQLYYHLAEFLERHNRLEAAQDVIEDALPRAPDSPALHLIKARLLKREKDYESALEILEQVSPEDHALEKDFYYEKAQIYDRLEDAANALHYYKKANDVLQRETTLTKEQFEFQPTVIRSYQTFATPEWYESWTKAPPSAPDKEPVFLLGFPRSGTTLLDQILTAHGTFTVSEERPAMEYTQNKILEHHGEFPGCLAGMDEKEIKNLRKDYMKNLLNMGDLDRTKRPVDKLPLNTYRLPLIHRLYPDAKIVFALRHPYDCVLSSFMQFFKLNTSMIHFLDLTLAAKFYDLNMQAFRTFRETFPLNLHFVRYENVVDDFENEIGKMLAFLGEDWNDDVLEYNKMAESRGHILTPSYQQVTEDIYDRARYRWKRYEDQLKDSIIPILKPWAEYFEYDER